MKMNGLTGSANKNGTLNKSIVDVKSYIIALGTGIITQSFLNPIYLISTISWFMN